MGNTVFKNHSSNLRGSFEDVDASVNREASKYGLTVYAPEKIRNMTNVGLYLGTSVDASTIFHTGLSVDYQDMFGYGLKNHTAVGFETGFELPPDLANALSLRITHDNWPPFHLGLLSFKLLGGCRLDEYYSAGADLGLHFGWNRVVSLIKLNLGAARFWTLDKELRPTTNGTIFNIALTFMVNTDRR